MSEMAVEQPAAIQAPRYRLYSLAGIVWAAFLGSTVAGGIVLGINYWRLGRKTAAWTSIIAGTAALVGIMAIAMVLPDNIPNSVCIAVPLCAFWAVARQLQGKAIDEHLAAGGLKSSNWKGVGIGVATGVLLATAFLGWMLYQGYDFRALVDTQHSVDMGHEQEVFYSRGATREMAERVGAILKEQGLFGDDQPRTVLIARHEISFVVGDGAWDDPAVQRAFRSLAERTAGALGGKPVTLRFVDENLKEKKQIVIP